jgi:hypothetical protein
LHGIGLIKMPDATRRRQSAEQIRVAEPFKADDNLREVNENAEFRFSLDGHAWSKKPGEPAQSLKSPNKL